MVDIAFPIKGWDTNHPRYAQPDGTSAALVNVVPFDRDFRARGSVRPGMSKYVNTQMGSGSQPVLLTGQVTTALNPASIDPDQSLINEPFTYADNTAVGSINSGNNWRMQVTNGGNTNGSASAANTLIVLGNTVVCNSSVVTGVNFGLALWKPTLTVGSAYVVQMDVYIDASNNFEAHLYFRTNNTGSGKFVQFGITKTQYWLLADSGFIVNAANFGTALSVGFHTMQVRVSGDTIFAYIDGTLVFTQVTTKNNTETAVGFEIKASRTGSGLGVKNFQTLTGKPLAAFRQTSLVAVCGGNIYIGDTTGLAAASGGTGVLSTVIKPQMASRAGKCYFVDSLSTMKVLDVTTKTVTTATVSTGSETATTLGANTLCCVWRDRLVVAAPAATPQNFFMSRQGDPTDWDYSQTDAAAAVAGNASRAGAIGEPLNCLIPWTDDVLLLGGDHSIYKVEGDIAGGGQILLVTDSVGTLGADCFDTDPNGNVYFAGSGGLYKLSPAGLPENIANETVRNFFSSIDRVQSYVCLTWDRDRNGLFIHVTPANTGPALHLFWDATTGGFFPLQYPDLFGPLTSVVFDGDGPLDRQLLLACRDGYIRKVDPTVLNDDGTPIENYVLIGPYRPAGDAALSVLEACEVLLGDAPTGFSESDFSLKINVYVAKDAYTAIYQTPNPVLSITYNKQARRKRLLQRISGGTFLFEIQGVDNKLWTFEKLVALFTEGGLQRRY